MCVSHKFYIDDIPAQLQHKLMYYL